MAGFKKQFLILSLFWFAAKIFHLLENLNISVGRDQVIPINQVLFSAFLQFCIGLIAIYYLLKIMNKFEFSFQRLLVQICLHLVVIFLFFSGTLSAGVTSFITFSPDASFQNFWEHMLYNYPSFLLGSTSSYGVLMVLSFGIHYFEKSQRQELEKTTLESKYLEVKLKGLRAQLNPHLLFNSLNAIVSFVDEQPSKAKNLLVDLSFLLRRLLDTSDKQFIPLEQELDFLRKYLELEKARFSDSLIVNFEIEKGLESVLVPNMILQPIVENSLIHGFNNSKKPSFYIGLIAKITENRLRIEIHDNGDGFPKGENPIRNPGVGISNILERLDTIYKKNATFNIIKDTDGVHNIIEFPVQYQTKEE